MTIIFRFDIILNRKEVTKMILANDISVGLAQMLCKYYDFIVEDGDCWAEGKHKKEKEDDGRRTEKE